MKKSIITILIAIIGTVATLGANNIALADSAYNQKRYQEALELYHSELKSKGTSSDLYYNIGCGYYKMQQYAQAILYFERALQLDPGNNDAKANLEFVREKAKVNGSSGSSFFEDLYTAIANNFTSNGWAVIAVISFFLLLGAIAMYIFMSSVALRKVGFFGGGVILVVCIFSIICSFSQHKKAAEHTEAIVMSESATLSAAPHAPSGKEVEGTLKAGQKVCIEDSVKNTGIWYKVTTPDSKQAWILSTDVEKI